VDVEPVIAVVLLLVFDVGVVVSVVEGETLEELDDSVVSVAVVFVVVNVLDDVAVVSEVDVSENSELVIPVSSVVGVSV
jgi:hypothetical protein